MRTTEAGVRDQWEALKRTGVVRKGHFVLASGLHTGEVINARAAEPWLMDEVFQDLSRYALGVQPDAMVGVPHGADHFVEYIAPMLHASSSYDRRVRPVMIEKGPDGMVVPDGSIQPGERILVLEDVFTTGGSIQKACEALSAAGAVVVGKFAIFNRSSRDGMAEEQGVEYSVRHLIEDYDPAECPICKEGVSLEKA